MVMCQSQKNLGKTDFIRFRHFPKEECYIFGSRVPQVPSKLISETKYLKQTQTPHYKLIIILLLSNKNNLKNNLIIWSDQPFWTGSCRKRKKFMKRFHFIGCQTFLCSLRGVHFRLFDQTPHLSNWSTIFCWNCNSF